jgi:uncharacterized protein (DUF1800 family)
MTPSDLLARFAGTGRAEPAPQAPSTRRHFLRSAPLLAALWESLAEAEQPPSRSITPNHWLVNRLTMGLNAFELNKVSTLGYNGYLEYHLNHTAINDWNAVEQRLSTYALLPLPAHILATIAQPYFIVMETVEVMILRAVLSRRQLLQRMVEFWADHFNVDINKGYVPWMHLVMYRDVLYAKALTTFPALLIATAQSPPMLESLDNDDSIAGNPNENYARELMELHTLGVDGGYTQQDVVEVARCFTGWGYYHYTAPAPNAHTFKYDDSRHDQGQKIVLGHVIPAGGGISDGFQVLDILIDHPSTARFVSKKLCKWFYSYDPPSDLVDAVAATYTATRGDVKEMLRTLFTLADPNASPLKLKRPFHYIVSALRASAAAFASESDVTATLRLYLTSGGQLPFHWAPPDGYPESISKWGALVLPRWHYAAQQVVGNMAGVTIDINTLLGPVTTADEAMNKIDELLFNNTMPAPEKQRIQNYLASDPTNAYRKREALGLAMSSPGFQWY